MASTKTQTSVEQVENGWIVTVTTESDTGKGINWESKKFVAASAKEAQAIVAKNMK